MKLKGLMVIRKPSGTEFTYYRQRGCTLIRLPDLPYDHPDFLHAYAEARQNATPNRPSAATGTISAAIEAHLVSDRHLALRTSTRAMRRRIFDHIREAVGTAMIDHLAPRHIRADIGGLTAHAANNRLKCWRALCGWAVEIGMITENPAAATARRRTQKTPGHIPWSRTETDLFRDHWPPSTPQRLTFELLHWTAARIGDAVRLGPGMVDRDGWIVYRQNKTGGEVAIPFNRDLPHWASLMQADLDLLHEAIKAQPQRAMTFMVTNHGSARSIKAASSWFAAAAVKAGLTRRSAHGLRKTRAQILAEAGATAHQIAAWTGHESLSEVQHYAAKADRRRILSGPDQERKVQTKPHSLQIHGKK